MDLENVSDKIENISVRLSLDLPSPELKDKSYNKLSRVSAGALEAIDMPIYFVGSAATYSLALAGFGTGVAGVVASERLDNASSSAFDKAKKSKNIFKKAALYVGGGIVKLTSGVVKLASGVATTALAIGTAALGLTTFAAVAPLAFLSKGILKLGEGKGIKDSKDRNKEVIIDIQPENVDNESSENLNEL